VRYFLRNDIVFRSGQTPSNLSKQGEIRPSKHLKIIRNWGISNDLAGFALLRLDLSRFGCNLSRFGQIAAG